MVVAGCCLLLSCSYIFTAVDNNKPQLDPPFRILRLEKGHESWSFEVAPGATTYSNPKAGAVLNAVDDIIHLYWKLG